MIDSFVAKNFRLFQSLEISELRRVNLFVGKNNSGKSALLEALRVYASAASPAEMLDLVSQREETWDSRARELNTRPSVADLRHLFRGHNLAEDENGAIVLGPTTPASDQLKLFLAPYQVTAGEDGEELRKRLPSADQSAGQADVEIWLVVQEGSAPRRIARLDSENPRPMGLYGRSAETPKFLVQLVPTQNMTADKVARLWDQIGLSDLAEDVIKGLRLIDVTIGSLMFVESKTSVRSSRLPIVRTSGSSIPIPLRSMGDGIVRLLNITLALANAPNGILLIDEFENGLHWSVQGSLWKAVFHLADRLNTQVFATTHSRDCVQGFSEAWKEFPCEASFHRLGRNKHGEIVARRYTVETLLDSVATDVEVR